MTADPLPYWLIVEGEPDMYDMWLVILEMWNIKGLAFTNADEAFGWVEEFDAGRWRPQPPELAILDLATSSTGHYSVVAVGERLRQSQLLNNVPIIITTAYKLTPQQEKDILKRSGADTILYKPVPRFSDLRHVLQKVIDARPPQNLRSRQTLLHRQLFER